MRLFNKKKNSAVSSSVLSESEIQKKLYGEFSDQTVHVVIGERESSKEPVRVAPVLPKEPSLEKDAALDLFSTPKEAVPEPDVASRPIAPETKAVENPSRYVPLHDFEKKSSSLAQPSSSPEARSRFPYNRPQENKWTSLGGALRAFSESGKEFFKFISDPKQVAFRRVFYWGAAILAVCFLFWGVNALNSQREEAMRSRYKIPGESSPLKAPEAVSVAAPIKPVAERPVVITPAPSRAAKTLTASSEPYVIQVVTYPSAQDAESVVKALKGAGFRAFVKESARPSGRIFYMVLIGGFRTTAEAQAQLLKFRGQEVARPFQDAFIRTNRS